MDGEIDRCMGSTRKIIGKIPRERIPQLIRLVAKRSRFGRKIKLNQLATIPSTERERELFQKFQKELAELRAANAPTKKIDVLKAKVKTVAISSMLGRQLGRAPTVYQVLAVTALQHGFSSKELKDQVTSMSSTSNDYPHEVTWIGNPHDLRKLIKRPLSTGAFSLPAIERILFKSKTEALDSRKIAARLGIQWIPENSSTINISLQFLEVCGMVKKMPFSLTWGRPTSVWMHRAYQNPKIDYPNLEMNILQKLSSGRKKLTELYSEQIIRSKKGRITKVGSKNAEFQSTSIMDALKLLEDAGIVKIQKHVLGNPRRGSKPGEAELTEYGQRLWNKYIRTGSLPEELRKLLLGEKVIKKAV